jgi:hypothetical protein
MFASASSLVGESGVMERCDPAVTVGGAPSCWNRKSAASAVQGTVPACLDTRLQSVFSQQRTMVHKFEC